MDYKIILLLVVLGAAFAAGQQAGETVVPNANTISNEFEQTKILTQSLPLYSYKQPTLKDLQACEATRDACYKNCTDTACLQKCPVCPIIIVQDTVIQGINDTDLPPPANTVARQNVTTVIKLKNVVHNIVDTNAPNVNSTNLNSVNVYQKNETSGAGGKFGLGETDEGPCCLAISKKVCHMSWNGPSCHKPRHRTCGSHCTSRVIRAVSSSTPRPRCSQSSNWPFVSCHGSANNCHGCHEYLINSEGNMVTIPKRCLTCFSQNSYNPPMAPMGPYYPYPCYMTGTCPPPFPYYSYAGYQQPNTWAYPHHSTNEEEEFDSDALESDFNPSEWKVEAKKCKVTKEDGTVQIVDCTEEPPLPSEYPLTYPRNPYELDMGVPSLRKQHRRRRQNKTKQRNYINSM